MTAATATPMREDQRSAAARRDGARGDDHRDFSRRGVARRNRGDELQRTLARDNSITRPNRARPTSLRPPPVATSAEREIETAAATPVSPPASSETIPVAKPTPGKAINAKTSPAPRAAAPAPSGAREPGPFAQGHGRGARRGRAPAKPAPAAAAAAAKAEGAGRRQAGIQDARVHRLSGPWRRPDRRDRDAGSGRLQPGAVRRPASSRTR